MSIERWDPFREMVALRDNLNRLFDETLMRPGSDWLAGMRERPAVNVYETDSAVVVEAHLPGVKRDEVEITISGTTLTIKGERHASAEVKEEHFIRREVHAGAFLRRIGLPETADLDKPEATFADGVLKVTFPKRIEPQAKRIELQPEQVSA
ncbi:MAG: Hsp20/alpha crystallin family protein [Chloroflexales bacterium]|nr:Hsp20/alpha crystallin family protein [Chloroflexales bacterium]